MRNKAYIISSYVDFWQSEETVTFRAGLDNLFQSQVHPVIAIDEVAVESLSVLQLDEHRVALRRGKQPERELEPKKRKRKRFSLHDDLGVIYLGHNHDIPC